MARKERIETHTADELCAMQARGERKATGRAPLP